MRKGEVAVAVGMEFIAHPVIMLGGVGFPVCLVIHEGQVKRGGGFADGLHVSDELAFAVGIRVRQDGTGGLEHGKCSELLDPASQDLQIVTEFGQGQIPCGAAVVHPDHDEDDIRLKRRNPPVEGREKVPGRVAADRRLDHNILRAPELKPQAFGEVFRVVALPEGVDGSMGDAVSIEDPFCGFGPAED